MSCKKCEEILRLYSSNLNKYNEILNTLQIRDFDKLVTWVNCRFCNQFYIEDDISSSSWKFKKPTNKQLVDFMINQLGKEL